MSTKRIVFEIEFNSRSEKPKRPAWEIGLTPAWIKYRMSIFMKYTLQSLKKQSNQDFVALVSYADRSEATIKQELSKHKPLPDNIQFVPISTYEEKIKDTIAGFDYLYLVRLDCDDMYHKSMVHQLRHYRPKPGTQVLVNQRGYLYDAVRKRYTIVRFKSPPFYTLIYRVQDYMEGKRYRIRGHGRAINLKHEILTKNKKRKNYMIVVHERNTLNQTLLRKRIFQTNRFKLRKKLRNYC